MLLTRPPSTENRAASRGPGSRVAKRQNHCAQHSNCGAAARTAGAGASPRQGLLQRRMLSRVLSGLA
jgi:hypothetical protein